MHNGEAHAEAAGELVSVADFDEVFRSYAPRVRRLLERYFGRGSTHAEDLTQDVFLKAYQARATIDPDRPLWPWLRTITHRVAIDELRTPRRQREHLSDAPAMHMRSTSHASGDDPYDRYVAGEHSSALTAAFRELPPRTRQLVLLKDGGGWQYEELATLEGASVPALRCAISRARRALRESYVAELAWRGLAAIVGPFARPLARFAAPLVRSARDRARRVAAAPEFTTRFAEVVPSVSNAVVAAALFSAAINLGALPAGLGLETAAGANVPTRVATPVATGTPASAPVAGNDTAGSPTGVAPGPHSRAVDVDVTPPDAGIPGPHVVAGGDLRRNNHASTLTYNLGVYAGPWVFYVAGDPEIPCEDATCQQVIDAVRGPQAH